MPPPSQSSNEMFGETARVSTLELVGHRGPVFATAWLPTAPPDDSPSASDRCPGPGPSAKPNAR